MALARSFRGSLRPAFTLIELMVATALAGLLMVALMSVVGSLSKHARILRERYPDDLWKQRLSAQMTWDFANTRQWRCTPERLTLVGFGGRNAAGDPTHVPTRVDYYIHREREQCWLFRREAHTNELTNQNHHTELASLGVSGLFVEIQPATAADGSAVQPREPDAIGDRMRLVLYGASEGQPILDVVLAIR